MALLTLLAAVATLGLLAWLVLARPGVGVDRGRLSRFAERQRLVVTAGNGAHVLRALTVTRRWRRFGLAAGLLVMAGWTALHGRLTIDAAAMFLGWFAGAAVAQWRLATPLEGSRRTAALAPRSTATYLTPLNRAVFWTVLALLSGSALAAGVATGRTDGGAWGPWLGWVAVTGAAGSGLWLTMRRVVERPQPAADPDLRDADDALRGHALTVLAGSAIAAAGLPLGEFLAMVARALGGGPDATGAIEFGALVVLVVVGWDVAAHTTSVRARAHAHGAVAAP